KYVETYNVPVVNNKIEKSLRKVMKKYGTNIIVHVGDNNGVDILTIQICDRLGIKYKVYRTDLNKHEEYAEFIRDEDIVREIDVLYSFPRDNSKETMTIIRLAKRQDI